MAKQNSMKNFRTTFNIPTSSNSIDYNTKTMLIGSCFSDNIGNKLGALKFNVLRNPHGVLYNPYSVQETLNFALGSRELQDNDLVYHNDLWHSYLHHSSFSEAEKQKLIARIETTRKETLAYLKSINTLFITFGTAWVYELKSSHKIVSNCHKIPSAAFKRFRLSTCDIVDEFSILIRRLQELNPELQIVFTLSPIRHLKDGAVENQLSKSILKVAIHELIEMHEQCSYFPSYELVMDDLRDYRFYADDMTHLSASAIAYIFERFAEVYIPEEARQIISKVEKLNRAVSHKPFNTQSESHQKFIKTTINQIKTLNKEISSQDWSNELQILNAQIIKP